MTRALTTRWDVHITQSSASFAVRNFGLKTVRGNVPITVGWVDIDADGRPLAIHAELDLTALETGNRTRDRDLRKPKLLDTDRHPTLAFDTRAIVGTAPQWDAHGILTGRGRATPVVLAVAAEQAGDATRAVATACFDRRDLAIRAPRLLIGRRIHVTIDAQLRPHS